MTPIEMHYEKLADSVIANLNKRNMDGYYCHTKMEAFEQIISMIPENATVGFGGSETVKELGLLTALENGNFQLIDRRKAASPQESREFHAKTMLADYYLMSSNAITYDGELVNIDGTGNRVSCLTFGPETVIIVAGINKLVPDVESGIARVHNIAAPPNGIRLDLTTPCAVTGRCGNCVGSQSMCCQTVITRNSRIKGRIKVFLIGETLGY